jgi:hypothetical protein
MLLSFLPHLSILKTEAIYLPAISVHFLRTGQEYIIETELFKNLKFNMPVNRGIPCNTGA